MAGTEAATGFEKGLNRATKVSIGLGAVSAVAGLAFESSTLVSGAWFFVFLGFLFWSLKKLNQARGRLSR